MKNISYDQMLISARGHSFWYDMDDFITVSRLEANLDTVEEKITRYVNDEKKTLTVVLEHLKSRGYVTIKDTGNTVYGVLPHAQENHIVAYVKFNTSEKTGALFMVGDAGEVDTLKTWYESNHSEIGSVIVTVEGFNPHGHMIKSENYLPKGETQKAHNDFYPWLSIPLDQYFDEFMKSDESVLVLFGPPGTGKSTFLRSLIVHGMHTAWLAYNREVVESPKLVSEFFQGNASILAYEDIDNFMDRRENGNMLMSTILNASEGILQHPGKKIVFSTNLPSIDRIDPALLRAGRCFDILHFQNLTQEEAVQARKSVGLSERDFSEKREWPLSEVLAKQSFAQQTVNRFGRRAGFI